MIYGGQEYIQNTTTALAVICIHPRAIQASYWGTLELNMTKCIGMPISAAPVRETLQRKETAVIPQCYFTFTYRAQQNSPYLPSPATRQGTNSNTSTDLRGCEKHKRQGKPR